MAGRARHWPSNRFQDPGFDVERCRAELDQFDALLAANAGLSERDQVLPFFRARPQLTAFLGSYNRNLASYDRLAFEFSLFGGPVADVVVGDGAKQAYCFVEFEDARAGSMFLQGDNPPRRWASRFNHGFNQIVDWFWTLDDIRERDAFEVRFGALTIDIAGLLVVGRDSGVAAEDRPRLVYRRRHVRVGLKPIYCCTFDELARELRLSLDVWSMAARAEQPGG